MLILGTLSTYRLTRLVTADRILERFRLWLEGRSEWLSYLATCDWCLSIWIGPVVATTLVRYGDNLWVVTGGMALSFSALTGLVSIAEMRASGDNR